MQISLFMLGTNRPSLKGCHVYIKAAAD